MLASRLTAALRYGAHTLAKTRTRRIFPCISRTLYVSTRLGAAKFSEFRLSKITQIFDNVYDTDNDGYFDKEDIENLKSRARRYMERVKGSAVKDTYKAGFEDYLHFLLSPAGKTKDSISRDEWIELWEGLIGETTEVSQEKLPQWVRVMPHSIFPLLDCKGDGVVDAEEYRDFWHHVGGYKNISDDTLKKYFDHMTEGGSKPLDLKRVEELYADYYLSDDPDSPGRYIAGPIDPHT